MAKKNKQTIETNYPRLLSSLGLNSVKKLFMAFGGLVLLFLILVASLVLLQIDRLTMHLDAHVEKEIPALTSAYRLHSHNQKIYNIYQSLLLHQGGNRQALSAKIEERQYTWEEAFLPTFQTLHQSMEVYHTEVLDHLEDSLEERILAYGQMMNQADSLFLAKGTHREELIDLHHQIQDQYHKNEFILQKVISNVERKNAKRQDQMEATSTTYVWLVLIALMLCVPLVVLMLYVIVKALREELAVLRKGLEHFSLGKPLQVGELKMKEVKAIVNPAIQVNLYLKKVVDFVDQSLQQSNGQDLYLEPLSEADDLAPKLNQAYQRLHSMEEEDELRNWQTEGLSKFVELLRKNDELKSLTEEALKEIVQYVGANQGAIFIAYDQEDDKDIEEEYLEMISCYAYDREKYESRKIKPGEGLLGQAYLEKSIMRVKRVPEDYIYIKSGLGDASPQSLLIIPLVVNEQIEGVLELASLEPFEDYQVDFLERLGESIGSAISNLKVNERTRRLLNESQEQTEQLRAQEEEMRQNMEELQSTQEEMSRKELELQKMYQSTKQNEEELKAQEEMLRSNMEQMMESKKEVEEKNKRINAILSTAQDAIITTDELGTIETVNQRTMDLFGYTEEEMLGQNVKMLMPSPYYEQHDEYIENYKETGISRAIGRTRQIQGKHKDGSTFYAELSLSETFIEDRRIFTGFIRDVNDRVEKEKELRQSHEQLLAAEEQARQNMEEMKTINEQLVDKERELKKALEESQEKERSMRENKENVDKMMEHTLKARHKAEEQSAVLNSILDSSKSAILMIDPKTGKLSQYNKVVQQLFGYSRKELRKMTFDQLINTERLLGEQSFSEALKDKGEIFEEMFIYTKEEKRIPARIHLNRIEYKDKEILTCFITDIAEQVAAQEELEQAYEEIKAQEEQLRSTIQELRKQSDEDQLKALQDQVWDYEAQIKELKARIKELEDQLGSK